MEVKTPLVCGKGQYLKLAPLSTSRRWLEVEAFAGIHSESPRAWLGVAEIFLADFKHLFAEIKLCSYLSFDILDIQLQRLSWLADKILASFCF